MLPGQCKYMPLVDETGGMLKDPVAVKLSEDRYWISIADSDLLLWVKGIAYGYRLEVLVDELPLVELLLEVLVDEEVLVEVVVDELVEDVVLLELLVKVLLEVLDEEELLLELLVDVLVDVEVVVV